ncbi:hypothetical protein CASFOL_030756 [Castilleja foliolosa]|uniref:Rad7 n=1 Tax=Castilleja foliolosa TaxID=1961234 RepID=A0ABD3C6V8_9LAMI
MVLLRSGAVPPKPSKLLAQENALVEPATPSKFSELLNQSTSKNSTPSSSDPAPESCSGLNDTTIPGTGTVRRCSARLASKLDGGESSQVSKRKKDEGQFSNLGKKVLDLANKDSGDEGVAELVTEGETASDGGKRKRKLSMEPKLLGFGPSKEDEEKRFMVLRSGKRAVKRKMEDDDDDLFEETENSKENDLLSSDDDVVEEDETKVLEKEMGVGREEKGKGKVGNDTFRTHVLKDEGQFSNLGKKVLDLANKDSGDEGVAELVTEGETASGGGKRKRKLSMEPKSSCLGPRKEDEQEKRFMVLRSGKRAVKIKMDGGADDDLLEETENSKENDLLSSDDDVVEEGEKKVLEKEMGVGREEKGKGKVGNGTFQKDVLKEVNIETGVMTRGKMKLGANASSSNSINKPEIRIENVHENSVSGANNLAANEDLLVEELHVEVPQPPVVELPVEVPQPPVVLFHAEVPQPPVVEFHVEVPQPPQPEQGHVNPLAAFNNNIRNREMRHRNFARRNAVRFAIFTSEEEIGNDSSAAPDGGVEYLPGEFSTAVKEKMDNGANKAGYGDSKNGLKWVPRTQDLVRCNKHIPSLQELCMSILCKNADAISSLEFIPDAMRHTISWFLCDGRGMKSRFLELLVRGSPTEVRVRDCSWLTEELVIKIFDGVDASNLMVLQFDLGGGCMPDYILHATLARSPNCLPALTTLSLKGAYRLTDVGLRMLTSAAPSLKSINISLCPLLTSAGICSLLNSLRLNLRELYLDYSDGVDAMLILPAMLQLEKLEVLSLAGIQTVSDDFISKFVSANGCRMKELGLADCSELTDLSLEVIGSTCSELRALDLSSLRKLTDVSMGHLANGCPMIEILKVCRSAFSDEAVSAYLDCRGESLKDLSLNNITRVSNNTALSIARKCRNLRRLDLSWCRNLTNEALGLIVDSCSLLEVLKLFGCTQVTNEFLDGHSNPQVKILGYKMTSIIKYIEVPDFLQGPLRYSSIYP